MKGWDNMKAIYDFDVENKEELAEIIHQFSNKIKELEERVESLENEKQ